MARLILPILIIAEIYIVNCGLGSALKTVSPFDPYKINLTDASPSARRKLYWHPIFPGTKWCGEGDVAANDTDFGVNRATDMCCRNHDMCPDIILAHQKKYNLTNPDPFTKLNCECDRQFHQCLKETNCRVSFIVGHIYFNIIGTQCFHYDYPNSCIRKEFQWLRRGKCVEYEFDETKKKQYEWFDVPDY